MQYVTTWMNLEDTTQSAKSQSQKGKYCMSPLYKVSKIVQFMESKSRMVVGRG